MIEFQTEEINLRKFVKTICSSLKYNVSVDFDSIKFVVCSNSIETEVICTGSGRIISQI